MRKKLFRFLAHNAHRRLGDIAMLEITNEPGPTYSAILIYRNLAMNELAIELFDKCEFYYYTLRFYPGVQCSVDHISNVEFHRRASEPLTCPAPNPLIDELPELTQAQKDDLAISAIPKQSSSR
jgi:hypothetical protein